MKRSASSSPSPGSATTTDHANAPLTPPTTPRKRVKANTHTNTAPEITPEVTPKKEKPASVWTADKKEKVVEILLKAGLGATRLEDIAQEVGLTKQQLRDATQGVKNNLRGRVIKAAGGL